MAETLYDLMNRRMQEVLRADLPHATTTVRDLCLATDPLRGVSCNLPLGHQGDHKSVAGFPFENEHFPKPRYEGASEDDMAAVNELLAVPAREPYVKTVAHHAFTTLSGGRFCNWRPADGAVNCGLPAEDPIHEDRCDDCGMKWPNHDTSVVEH